MENQRISDSSKRFMIGTAIFLDILGLIPILGVVINWIGAGVLYLWFISKRVDPVHSLSKKKTKLLAYLFGETVVEALLAWPGLTLMTLQTIREANKEDREAQEENEEETYRSRRAADRQPQRRSGQRFAGRSKVSQS